MQGQGRPGLERGAGAGYNKAFKICRFTVFNIKVAFLPLFFTVVTEVTIHRDRQGLDWREGQF